MIRNRKRASTLQEDWTQEVRLESNLGSGVLLPSLFEKKKKKSLIAGYLKRICGMMQMMIRIWGERIQPLSLAGWHSGVERGGRGRGNLLPFLSLPFLSLATKAIGPLWLMSSSPLFKKLNNGIHWISLYPLLNVIGFPTPGIWPLNLPGE